VVSAVPPQFDAASRTLKVRLEADNPDYLLRPDMFVDVEFSLSLPPAITVPGDAVLDAGVRKTVFVDRGNGFFEPRRVEIGWRYGDRVEITSGLTEGERIVVSGNFLIDSESRMRASARLEEAGVDRPAVHQETGPQGMPSGGRPPDSRKNTAPESARK
jgi:multidrug efflux pump subunit AcrA (membrane-fusion protein)